MLMEENQGLQDLVQEALCLLFGQGLVAMLSHVFLEIKLNIFKDKVQLVLGVDDLNQTAKMFWFNGIMKLLTLQCLDV